jgi:hypothetical protein
MKSSFVVTSRGADLATGKDEEDEPE